MVNLAVLISTILSSTYAIHASASLLTRRDNLPIDGAAAKLPSSNVAVASSPFYTLSAGEVSSYRPLTHFASAAYCKPADTITWSCGVCAAIPTFHPVAADGDGSSVQYWYVGYDTGLDTVIVAYQGSSHFKISADLSDLKRTKLDSDIFPGIDHSIEVHKGFADEHRKTAQAILEAIEVAIVRYNVTKVTIVGHSLGGALALLQSVYLPLHLPTEVSFRTVTYGMPRVGNQEFANHIDTKYHNFVHINNKHDDIPIIPELELGYHHPSGEVHIQDSEEWVKCPGQDNKDTRCSTGLVHSVAEGIVNDHDGPYDGVSMGC